VLGEETWGLPGNPEASALLAVAEPRFVEQTYRETLTPGDRSQVEGFVGNCHDHGSRTEGRFHFVPNQRKLGRPLDSVGLSLSRGREPVDPEKAA